MFIVHFLRILKKKYFSILFFLYDILNIASETTTFFLLAQPRLWEQLKIVIDNVVVCVLHRSGGKECVCSFCGCRLYSTMLWESSSGSSPVWSQDSLHHSPSWAPEPWIIWSALLLTFRRVSVCSMSLTPSVSWKLITKIFHRAFVHFFILSLEVMYSVSQGFSYQNSRHFIFLTIFFPTFRIKVFVVKFFLSNIYLILFQLDLNYLKWFSIVLVY